MIFVTVGTQLPFDRLVDAVDAWAGRNGGCEVFAQVGPTALRPRNLEFRTFLEPAEFSRRFSSAELVVAHAGMGSILSAMRLAKPILVMPRRACLNEHRSDHQLATARRFRESGRVLVAMDAEELEEQLSERGSIPAAARIGAHASGELLSAIRAFIVEG